MSEKMDWIAALQLKFKSGNAVKVDQATITREEYNSILNEMYELGVQVKQHLHMRKVYSTMVHNKIVEMQTVCIVAVNESPEVAMQWLENVLDGPDLMPTNEDIKMGAQEFSDENREELPDLH